MSYAAQELTQEVQEQAQGYKAVVLADSVSKLGYRLTTMLVTFPRIVLAEFNTHRMLSRNSASSRAIPVQKRIQQVLDNPFVPEAFGRNQRGMQAAEVLQGDENNKAREEWLLAMQAAVEHARNLAALEVHKQLANRLLEPFLWHTAIVSATEWDNFFALRCHPDAQPEIRRVAELMREEMRASRPEIKAEGSLHLPFVGKVDWQEALDRYGIDAGEQLAWVSAARCARVSYLTHDGRRDLDADLNLAQRLREAGHMSPFEHVAKPIEDFEPTDTGNFRGWLQLRKMIPHEGNFARALETRERLE